MDTEVLPPTSDGSLTEPLRSLAGRIKGRILADRMNRVIYATDASAYRELPMGIVLPEGVDDLRTVIRWAAQHHAPLVPRGAGTSVGGQVVGSGLLVDMRRFDHILEFDRENH